MKLSVASAIVGVLALGSSSATAAGFAFTPANTSFTASGTMALRTPSGNLNCSVQLGGKTTNRAEITSATFSGDTGCSDIMGAGLPWHLQASRMTSAHVRGVTLVSPSFGQCGQNEVYAKVSGGTITLRDFLPSQTGQTCHINASLTSTPAITIAPK